MPQFKPTYINIPKEIRENPEKFGLQQHYSLSGKPDLNQVEWLNQIAVKANEDAMLTDEQWENYWEAVKIIKSFEHELAFVRIQEQ